MRPLGSSAMSSWRLLVFTYLTWQLIFFGGMGESPRVLGSKGGSQREDGVVSRIAFGSCRNQSAPQPIWKAVSEYDPEVFVWLGDNIYADAKLGVKFIGSKRTSGPWKNVPRFSQVSVEELRQKYLIGKTTPGYEALRKTTEIIGTWDDHDYGLNDAGKELPLKDESQQLMLDFLDEPTDSPRRKQKGVYAAYTYGPVGKRIKALCIFSSSQYELSFWAPTYFPTETIRSGLCAFCMLKSDQSVSRTTRSSIQVILLDTRYHRDQMFSNGAMLGETQWAWLEREFNKGDAQVNIIGSSIQVISNMSAMTQPFFHVESWANFPAEQARMFSLITKANASGVIFLSGDVHFCEITRYDCGPMRYPLYDITSSGLTQAVEEIGNPILAFLLRLAAWIMPNTMRVYSPQCRNRSCVYGKRNFGTVEVDWDAEPVLITMRVRDEFGRPVSGVEVPLTMLQPGAVEPQPLKQREVRRNCTMEVDLPWSRKYLLACLFFGTLFFITVMPCATGYFTVKTLRARRRREPNQKPD